MTAGPTIVPPPPHTPPSIPRGATWGRRGNGGGQLFDNIGSQLIGPFFISARSKRRREGGATEIKETNRTPLHQRRAKVSLSWIYALMRGFDWPARITYPKRTTTIPKGANAPAPAKRAMLPPLVEELPAHVFRAPADHPCFCFQYCC